MAERLEPEVRRERIILATLALMAEEGYRGLSLRQVARHCDMTAPGLMHHFPDLPTLLMAVLDYRDSRDRDATADPLSADPRAMCDRVIEGMIARPADAQLFAMLEAEAIDPAHPAHDYFRDRADRLVRELSPYFAPQYRDPEALVRRIIAIWDGVQLQYLRDRDAFDLRGHWKAIADPLFAAYRR